MNGLLQPLKSEYFVTNSIYWNNKTFHTLCRLIGFDELDVPDLLYLPSGHEKKLAIPESLDKLVSL